MLSIDLGEFIAAHRDDVIRRCKAKVAQRLSFVVSPAEMDEGIPLFVDQMIGHLEYESPNTEAIRSTATEHGHNLFLQGLTIGQVVHDYGGCLPIRLGAGSGIESPSEPG